jgi:methanogenic corrinoid protein MtbC1
MCPACERAVAKNPRQQDIVSGTRGIRLFFQEIHQSVRRREFLKARELLEKAAHLGIDDTSLVFGVLQPTLRNIGLMWEAGLIDVGQEHAYTDIVVQTLELLSAKSPYADACRQSARPAALLACVNGNSHSVGIRMLEYYLSINNVPSHLLAPGVPALEIAAAAAKLKPAVIGLSFAISFQAAELENIKKALADCPPPAPAVYVGGSPIRAGYVLPAYLGFTPLTDFTEFLGIVKGAANG